MRIGSFGTAAGSALLLAATPAFADSITPTTFAASIAVGGTATVNKTVTVSAGTPTTAKADVLFVTDTTGSMGSTINAVKTGFSTIASSLSGNFAFGAAQYKDRTNSPSDPFDYHLDQAITTNLSAVQSAINGWSASGGGDIAEQGLYALSQASGASTGWRPGAKKIIVLAGDAPSHDNAHPAVPVSTTVGSVAGDLVSANVTTESVNVGDINADGQFNGPGSIYAAGASGDYFVSLDPSTLVAQIIAAIGSAFSDYSTVTLDLSGVPAGLTASLVPADYTGSFDRSTARNFGFDLTFTGVIPGTYSFNVNALVDGAIVATESDRIVVGGGTAVPEPASLAVLGAGLLGFGFMRRRCKS